VVGPAARPAERCPRAARAAAPTAAGQDFDTYESGRLASLGEHVEQALDGRWEPEEGLY